MGKAASGWVLLKRKRPPAMLRTIDSGCTAFLAQRRPSLGHRDKGPVLIRALMRF